MSRRTASGSAGGARLSGAPAGRTVPLPRTTVEQADEADEAEEEEEKEEQEEEKEELAVEAELAWGGLGGSRGS